MRYNCNYLYILETIEDFDKPSIFKYREKFQAYLEKNGKVPSWLGGF